MRAKASLRNSASPRYRHRPSWTCIQRLTGLEREGILNELAELLKLIERLLAILSSELVMQIVIDELREVQAEYGDLAGPRFSRTKASSASRI